VLFYKRLWWMDHRAVCPSTLMLLSECVTNDAGYGGHCYNQTCVAGSWEATFDAWYTSNLQISIPVTIVVSLIVRRLAS
jgi:hypothetical protein